MLRAVKANVNMPADDCDTILVGPRFSRRPHLSTLLVRRWVADKESNSVRRRVWLQDRQESCNRRARFDRGPYLNKTDAEYRVSGPRYRHSPARVCRQAYLSPRQLYSSAVNCLAGAATIVLIIGQKLSDLHDRRRHVAGGDTPSERNFQVKQLGHRLFQWANLGQSLLSDLRPGGSFKG